MIAQLIELERQFWTLVEEDRQPPADGSDSADLALRCLYPGIREPPWISRVTWRCRGCSRTWWRCVKCWPRTPPWRLS
jgi:hypothetical protein